MADRGQTTSSFLVFPLLLLLWLPSCCCWLLPEPFWKLILDILPHWRRPRPNPRYEIVSRVSDSSLRQRPNQQHSRCGFQRPDPAIGCVFFQLVRAIHLSIRSVSGITIHTQNTLPSSCRLLRNNPRVSRPDTCVVFCRHLAISKTNTSQAMVQYTIRAISPYSGPHFIPKCSITRHADSWTACLC